MQVYSRMRGLGRLLLDPLSRRSSLSSFQSASLRALVRHAYDNVSYYRDLFDRAGLAPGDIGGIEDLSLLPVTSRDRLQEQPGRRLCTRGLELDRLRSVTTSGSTGEPLTVRRTGWEEQLLLCLRVRAFEGLGLGLRMRRLAIDHYNPEALAAEAGKAYEKVGILPRLMVDWRTPRPEMVELAERFEADVLSGPPSILSWIASDFSERDRRRMGLRLVITGAESSTPSLREHFEEAFGAPVADLYGSHEVVFIALKSPLHPGYRVCRDAVILEVLGRDNRPVLPGEAGEAVVTALHSFAMPFIRYRLGDELEVAEVEPATGHPISLARVRGRSIDRFRLPDGRALHGYALGDLIQEAGLRVRRFQIVQEKKDAIRVVLSLRDSDAGKLADLERRLGALLGPDVHLDLDPGGSFRDQGRTKFCPFISLERHTGAPSVGSV